MEDSIDKLRIYQVARTSEDTVYELVRAFPVDEYYGLGNDLRRSSAGVSHHIATLHRLFSYRLKLDELRALRREAEATQVKLEQARGAGYIPTDQADTLFDAYTSIIKQSWGLSKWLQAKLDERLELANR